jgi:hypothetical protein
MNSIEQSIIAKDNDRVIAYLLAMTRNQGGASRRNHPHGGV